jgi:hypothetical protein
MLNSNFLLLVSKYEAKHILKYCGGEAYCTKIKMMCFAIQLGH